MGLGVVQVDAFTSVPFRGNPAAVLILPEPRPAEWMQDVARELNLSDSAFLVKQNDGYDLRWFTPVAEIDLCGHATLAAAHVLWETGRLAALEAPRFHTKSGLLTVRKVDGWIEMDFPSTPAARSDPPRDLLEGLGTSAGFVGRSKFDYLVELRTELEVRNLKPDFALLKTIACRGIIVTSKSSSSEQDFVSRFFAPSLGIDEDPVTGSAHCALAPYWRERLAKDDLTGYQASARGGVVKVGVRGDRVLIRGQAVTVMTGELTAG